MKLSVLKGVVIFLLYNPFFSYSKPLNDTLSVAPKVGLVLSGGGVNGLAHIGLLKLIDSLNIKVDYITGTSMGGIIGGLYAIGYSGKEIEEIALNIDWISILSNKVSLNEVSIEEKDEYDRYIIEFPVENGRPKLPGYLIEGQYLSEVLNTLTYSARNITDFSKLPIPFATTSIDILNGELIIQKQGSLPLALRATMAMPGVFSPVCINGKLVVDGGLERNFPVQEVKEMGADFVIGAYTGFRLSTEKEIENPIRLIYQTHAFKGVANSCIQKEQTDILIDFTNVVYEYSPADFSKYKEIIKIGSAEAYNILPELLKLSELQKKKRIKYKHELIEENYAPTVRYNFMSDRNEPITDPHELKMLQSLLGLKPGKFYPVEKINEGIHRVYATRFYKKVYYTFTNTAQGVEMNVHVKKAKQGYFKAAIHYDTDQQAGIIFNYTYRNLIGKHSRLVTTIDFSERFKARINYYKFIDNKNRIWIKPSFEYINLKNTDLNLAGFSMYRNQSFSDYFNRHFTISSGIGYSINKNSFIESGLSYEAEQVFKRNNVLKSLFNVFVSKPIYMHKDMSIYARFVQNSTDFQYFPTQGNKLTVELRYYFANTLTLNKPQEVGTLTNENDEKEYLDYFTYFIPDSWVYVRKGIPGNVLRFYINEQCFTPLSSKLSFLGSVFLGFVHGTLTGISDDNFFYFSQRFHIGGTDPLSPPSNPNFIGLRQSELLFNNPILFSLGFQYHPFKKIYLIPMVSYFNGLYDLSHLYYPIKEAVLGYGIDVGWMSTIGPVKFSVSTLGSLGEESKGDDASLFPWRGYFSFGYKF